MKNVDRVEPVSEAEEPVALNRPLVNCLEPLLNALHWPGKRQHILEALPYMTGITNLDEFIQTMSALHYDYVNLIANLKAINPHLTPCLFIANDQRALVVLEIADKIRVYDGQMNTETLLDKTDI